MPDRVITAEALITAKDGTGDVFEKIAKKIQDVGKVSKISPDIERMGKALDNAQKQLRVIEHFDGASKTLGAAELAMKGARQQAEQLGAQIAAMEKPNRAMQRDLALAEKAVMRTTAAFKRQGEDVMVARKALELLNIPVNTLNARQKQLEETIEQTTKAIDQQIAADREAVKAAEQSILMERRRAEEQRHLAAEERERLRDQAAEQRRLEAASREAAREQRQAAREQAEEQRRLAMEERDRLREQAEEQRRLEAARREGAREQLAAAKARQVAEERIQHAIAKNGFGHFVAGNIAAGVSAHGVFSGIERSIEAGAERQHVLTGMTNAGMGADEIKRAQQTAAIAVRGAPNLSMSEVLELHKEARSAVKDPEDVFALMPDLARAAAVLKGSGAENANVADLVKGAESMGLMKDPEKFRKFLDAQVRAMNVMGKTISTEQIYEAEKYSKSAGATLSDSFVNLVMPSLIQELHGSSAGDALSTFEKSLRGGLQHKHTAVMRLNELGLLEDPSQIKRSKTGEIMGYMGKLKGDDMLSTDLDKWTTQVFEPAAKKLGVTKLADMTKLLYEILPPTAANLGRIFLQQEDVLKQHRENYLRAPDLETAIHNQLSDPKVAVKAFEAALDDLESAVTSPMMPTIGHALNTMAVWIRDLSDIAAKHPFAAGSAGWGGAAVALGASGYLGYKVWDGFGLGTAATALDGSAVALNEAAAALSGSAVAGKAGAAARATAGAMGAWEFAAGAGAVGLFAGLGALVEASHDAQKPGAGGAYAPATQESEALDSDRLTDMRNELAATEAQIAETLAKSKLDSGIEPPTLGPLKERAGELRIEIDQLAASLKSLHDAAKPAADRGLDPNDGFVIDPKHPNIRILEGGPAATQAGPADAADRARERQDLMDQNNDQVQKNVWTFGQLDAQVGVVHTSFASLDDNSKSLANQLSQAAMAAAEAALALRGMGGDGMGGITNASFAGGGFGGNFGLSGGDRGGGGGAVDFASSTVNQALPPEARAFLDDISSGEAKGYNVLNGGGHFGSYAGHPGGRAAGRYQDLPSTWRRIAKATGLKDFSPDSQDKGNWWLAQQDYRAHTGRNLLHDLKSKDPAIIANIGRALHGTWISTNSAFASKYNHFLEHEKALPPIGPAPERAPAPSPEAILKGQAQMRVEIKVDGPGRITRSKTQSIGHVRATMGNTGLLGQTEPDALNI